jgi:hypothetical protein
MTKVELFAAIRRDSRIEGLSQRALADKYGVGRRTGTRTGTRTGSHRGRDRAQHRAQQRRVPGVRAGQPLYLLGERHRRARRVHALEATYR